MSLNTASIKTFIEGVCSNSSRIQEELEAHGVDDFSSRRWRRTRKRKVSAPTEYRWLYEDLHADFVSDGMASTPSRSLNELIGCIERGFLHTDADAFVSVITDPMDSDVVAWSFQID